MEPDHDVAPADEPPPILNRTDTGGPWSVAWPLIALALIGLVTVRACVASLPAAPVTAPALTAPSSR